MCQNVLCKAGEEEEEVKSKARQSLNKLSVVYKVGLEKEGGSSSEMHTQSRMSRNFSLSDSAFCIVFSNIAPASLVLGL